MENITFIAFYCFLIPTDYCQLRLCLCLETQQGREQSMSTKLNRIECCAVQVNKVFNEMEKVLRVKFIVIVLLEEALVESVWPVVLKLGPVQVILKVVALGEPEADPEGGVAGDDVANLPSSLDLDLFDDYFGPEFS